MIFTRKTAHNRPRKSRISTPSGWVVVTREDFGSGPVEVVRTESSGIARALVVAHGFSRHKGAVPKAPQGTPTKAKPVAPQAKPVALVRTPTVPGAVALLGGTVDEVDDAIDVLEEAGRLSASLKNQLIIAERAGKARKGVLRRLGVVVE